MSMVGCELDKFRQVTMVCFKYRTEPFISIRCGRANLSSCGAATMVLCGIGELYKPEPASALFPVILDLYKGILVLPLTNYQILCFYRTYKFIWFITYTNQTIYFAIINLAFCCRSGFIHYVLNFAKAMHSI